MYCLLDFSQLLKTISHFYYTVNDFFLVTDAVMHIRAVYVDMLSHCHTFHQSRCCNPFVTDQFFTPFLPTAMLLYWVHGC